ncbi:type IV pilus biogenesis protein PilP [Hydrogenovibrio sp. SC-1]|uniref:type IV pilus biogenesis protein PilP n=1 Tax=Hydrogenovibrio sp. SC-1 TaxID=2065820 RepID=UPI000C7B2847|nr:type IV pilus biogenesis protein PilP [Hydrogenovibrio sp. SC-1]PLA73944.1 type IV pilus biogenesis protein PilP [Hydrogenovibrio sp. SC-1]
MLKDNFKKGLWLLLVCVVSPSVFAEKSGIELSKEISAIKADTALLKAKLELQKTRKALNDLEDSKKNSSSNLATQSKKPPTMGAVGVPYTVPFGVNPSTGSHYGLNAPNKNNFRGDSPTYGQNPEPVVILIEGAEDKLTATLLVASGVTKIVRVGDIVGKWKIKNITSNGVESETIKDKETVFFSFGNASYQFSSNSEQ